MEHSLRGREQELPCRSPACRVGGKTWGERRCQHAGEGAGVSGAGLGKWVDYIPSREQLGQEKALIHTGARPLALQRRAEPFRSGFPAENEETKPLKMTDAWFLLLGITRSPAGRSLSPLPSLQAAAQSTARAPAPAPFHLEAMVHPWQLVG